MYNVYKADSGKSSTHTVDRLGTVEEVKSRFKKKNTHETVKEYIKGLRYDVTIKPSWDKTIAKNEQHSYHGGYLLVHRIYHDWELDNTCSKIELKRRNKFDLDVILQTLLYTMVLYLGSKRSSLEVAKPSNEQPECDIHQMNKALYLLAEESDTIQANVYKRSLAFGARNSSVFYYDSTNYHFESGEKSGLRLYGHLKEAVPTS